MAKLATTIEEQLDLLESRGLIIADKDKAREILLDVGYYRLGFYLFPFEKTYPEINNRSHQYFSGASFEDAVNLYYFDVDLRMLLMRYLNRIEIAFRTALIYNLSNKYNTLPFWYVDKSVVNEGYADSFRNKVYTSDFRRNPVIHRHHKKNPCDLYAPAWKTLEFMTFGAVMKLYEELNNESDKRLIAQKFGIRQVVTFVSYMHVVRQVRNVCAHGLLLYDMRLTRRINRGPARVSVQESGNIIGALRVIKYIVEQISYRRADELGSSIRDLYQRLCNISPNLRKLIPNFSTIS